jgi:hypothetical protein
MQHTIRSLIVAALVAAGMAFLGSTFIGKAKADTWDKTTYVTLHERTIAGNKVLEPGTYVWKLLDSQSDRHIVQIFDKDQRHLEETIIALPNYRLEPAGDSRFAFWETPAGAPKAIRAWFYPGDNFGQEFKYPKKLVAQFATIMPVPVPTSYREPEPAPAPTASSIAEPQPQPAAIETAPEPAPQPASPASGPVPSAETPAPALPHTASNIPLIGLLGLGSLGLAGVLSMSKGRS